MIKGSKPPSASDNSLNSRINYIDNAKMQVTFDGSCLKQKKGSLNSISADWGQKCPAPYSFSYIFQTTRTIILIF